MNTLTTRTYTLGEKDMPTITMISKDQAKHINSVIAELEEKCSKTEMLAGLTAKYTNAHWVNVDHWTEDGPAIVAVAIYENGIRAIYLPEYLEESQLVVVDSIFTDIMEDAIVITFSPRDYELVRRYGKYIKDVRLFYR